MYDGSVVWCGVGVVMVVLVVWCGSGGAGGVVMVVGLVWWW